MRLIDADALLEQMKHRRDHVGRPSDPVCLVEDAPTVATDINVLGTLTDEAAIEHLQASGWMQRHDRAMTRPPWVNAEERLPDEKGIYLARTQNEEYKILEYFAGEWATDESGAVAKYKITHWMPLPEPPEKKMTLMEALELLENEKMCVLRNEKTDCGRKCETCDLVKDTDEILDMYDLVIEVMQDRIVADNVHAPEEKDEEADH